MDHATVATYNERGLDWAATHAVPHCRAEAEAFAARVPRGELRIDLGCGAGRYLPFLGTPTIALDASEPMLTAGLELAPDSLGVLADVEDLPFGRNTIAGAWSWMTHHHLPRARHPLAFRELHRVLKVGAPLELQMMAGAGDGYVLYGVKSTDRWFSASSPQQLTDLLTGAGFLVDETSIVVDDDELRLRATRGLTLADTVNDQMDLLVCGLNPSILSAEVGVGFARKGNRFWPAALAAGLVTEDRNPLAALVDHRIGMTDLVKRATARASELGSDEYRAGLDRIDRLVGWLQPRTVCFVGLSGWRTAGHDKARPGRQEETVGGRPVYVMPSTSGLNAHSSLADLTGHLTEALALARES